MSSELKKWVGKRKEEQESGRRTFLLNTLLASLMYVTSPSSSFARFRDELARDSILIHTHTKQDDSGWVQPNRP